MRTKFLLAVLVFTALGGALLFGSLPGSAAVFMDDFNDNTTDTWFWYINQSGGQTVTETNQRLEIYHPSNVGAGYGSTCQIRGDFDIQVDFDLVQWGTLIQTKIGLSTSLGTVGRGQYGSSETYHTQFQGDTL